MSRRRVLAISQDLEQLRRIVANLERAGAGVEAVRAPDAIPGKVIPHRYVFWAASPGQLEAPAAALARFRPGAQIALIVPESRLADLIRPFADARVSHAITGEELDRGVFVTAQKLLTGDIFGIEKYLPAGTPVQYARVRDYEERGQALEQVLEYAAQARMRRQVRDAIGQVCDELLTNALYDAPVDEGGRPLFAAAGREERIRARSPRPVSIRYAATESQFAVAVRDRFGRLSKRTLVGHIEKCATSPDPIDRKQLGSGLGLYLVASSAASVAVNIAYGVATEIVCTFDRGAKSPLRLLGVFVHPDGAVSEGAARVEAAASAE